ncbi:DUF397 domain-containing protein [Streptomyces sp. NPDC002790]|uniref:DUF397 domain-containing protein n=1 Tax=Streptomyces sp. NPDC002790 TaxID=3154431 RepID=UPI0033295E15
MNLAWFKSSYSSGSDDPNCVEVAHAPGVTHIRDSKHPRSPHCTVSGAAWTAFLRGRAEG